MVRKSDAASPAAPQEVSYLQVQIGELRAEAAELSRENNELRVELGKHEDMEDKLHSARREAESLRGQLSFSEKEASRALGKLEGVEMMLDVIKTVAESLGGQSNKVVRAMADAISGV